MPPLKSPYPELPYQIQGIHLHTGMQKDDLFTYTVRKYVLKFTAILIFPTLLLKFRWLKCQDSMHNCLCTFVHLLRQVILNFSSHYFYQSK